jgi:colicin import membrane protein
MVALNLMLIPLALVLSCAPAWAEAKTQLVGRWQLEPDALRPLIETRVAELREEHADALERMAAGRECLDLVKARLSRAEQQAKSIRLRFHSSAQPGSKAPPVRAILLVDTSVANRSALEQVMNSIFGQWRGPGAPTPNQYAVIAVDIGGRGRVTRLTVTDSSGNTDFDKAALRAIERSAPFPDLASDRERDRIAAARAEVRVLERQLEITAGEVRDLERRLQSLHKRKPEELGEVLIDFFSDGAGLLTTTRPYKNGQTLPFQWSADADELRVVSALERSPVGVQIVRLTRTELVIGNDGPLSGSSGTVWPSAESPATSRFKRVGP